MNGSPAYRTSQTSPSQPLPSLAEIAAAQSMTLTAPAAALAALCARVSEAAAKEFTLELSLFGDLLFGAGITCAIATVAGIARLLGAPGGVPLLIVCFFLGTIYGVVKIVLARVRFVDRRTGQDVTVVMPLAIGFGVGFFACIVELVLALSPIPSAALALVLALGSFGLWHLRYRPRTRGLSRVPGRGVTELMLAMADPMSVASIAWNDVTASPSAGPRYSASIARADGVLVTCSSHVDPQGEVYQVVADFPAMHAWRHASPTVSIDGHTLECHVEAGGTRVQATVRGRGVLQAISLVANACAPARP